MATWKKHNRTHAAERICFFKKELDKAMSSRTCSTSELHQIRMKLHKAYYDEETFWKLKSRNTWLYLGDRHTKFFYAATKNRLAIIRIMAIEDSAGCTTRGDKAVGQVAEDYFKTLFTSTRNDSVDYLSAFEGFQSRVTPAINDELTKTIIEEQIRAAIFAIGPDRAPGPDGISGAFYHPFWPEIKEGVIDEVLRFFDNSRIRRPINHTNLCLLSKVDAPWSMSDFRPIALCNVSYKIISKILVNRLKNHLSSIIS